MSKKLPAGCLKWIENTSQLNEGFVKNCNEDSDEVYFPWKITWSSTIIYKFYLKQRKMKQIKNKKTVENLN